ncbi:hypothetical protein ACWEO1_39555 [Kitasatospora cineracea]
MTTSIWSTMPTELTAEIRRTRTGRIDVLTQRHIGSRRGVFVVDWIRVPVGADSARWTTWGDCRHVLPVVHNATSVTRLLDVVGLFRDDLRVQLTATCPGTSPFRSGLPELLAALGVPVLPWDQALVLAPDLAISAGFGGQLAEIRRGSRPPPTSTSRLPRPSPSRTRPASPRPP